MSNVSAPPVPDLLPIAAAAVATTFIERKRLFKGQSSIDLCDALANRPNGAFFNAAGGTATVRNYTLENVILDASTLLLLKDGRVIAETAYFLPSNDNGQRSMQPTAPLGANEVLIFGTNNAHWGYQHWLTQCLPAIDWSLRQPRTFDVRLLLPNMRPWQEDFLELLGYASVPRLMPRPGELYVLPRVEFSEFISGASSFEISLTLLDTVRRILDAVPSLPSAGKLLYLPDPNAQHGSISNEAAAIELLCRHGFTVVDRDRFGTAERINLFRQADVVVGPLAPHLADVVFCRPGALLWEWMPQHQQNHTFNRLAQTARVDYWGDLFQGVAEPVSPGEWQVDLDVVARRLATLSTRTAPRTAAPPLLAGDTVSPPLEVLMLCFESLGDSCEFGLVQRNAGVEPLGLMRFNGIHVPPEFRLERLVAALERKFEGLGAPGSITVTPEGLPGQRELMVYELSYNLHYHTGIFEGSTEPLAQAERETTRLKFLRRKLLEDLESGTKIFIWKSTASTLTEHVRPLLDVLRRMGPNTLLWVVKADADHPPGSVELLEPGFIKGYVRRFAPWPNTTDIDWASWFEVCWHAHELRHGARETAKLGEVTTVGSASPPRPATPVQEAITRPVPVRAPLALADVAETKVFIERERIFHGQSVIRLGDTLASHPSAVFFKAIAATITLRNYTLRNIVLDADTLLLLKDGEIIPETSYFAPAYDHRQPLNEKPPIPLGENEVFVFGYNNQHWGYQHWLTQCLPAIDWSLRQTPTHDVRLLLPNLTPWQEDFLRLLGHADVPRFRPLPGERYRLPNLEFSEFINGVNSFGISRTLLDTIQRILDAVPSCPSPDKVLYVRNTSPYYGAIRNEATVIDMLRQHGVTIVEPERLGVAERINLFRHADVVIGPLGPYLADVMFCRPGAVLWEWMPRHHQNHTFCCLAQAALVDYWGDLFEAAADPRAHGEWEVDLGIVTQRLAELSARLALMASEPPAPRTQSTPVRSSASPEKLMLRFESLGDDCEFGLLQRHAGAEPLGLLRFNGFRVPLAERMDRLITGIERKFAGLGDPGTFSVVPKALELFVSDSLYNFWYHTGVTSVGANLEDLESGEKIFVWKSSLTTRREQVQPLLALLRRMGPNTLLWVVLADENHPQGTVEELEPDFLKGYIRRWPTSDHLSDIDYRSWLEMCWRVDELRPPAPEDVEQPAGSALELSAHSPPAVQPPQPAPPSSMFTSIRGWLGMRPS
jgi:capsular polysaccharide biosynthesis protein